MTCNGNNLKFTPAIQAMGPHTAPLGMRFYRWQQKATAAFPSSYGKNISIAQHGSWNRNRPIGARVMRVVLDPSKPNVVLKYEPFLSGGVPGDTGLPSGPNPPVAPGATYNGRPVDVEQLPDGSLLVSDDFANAVYRITYNGASGCHTSYTKKPSKDKVLGSRGRRLTEDGPCCGYGTDKPTLAGVVVQGADQGCAVNLGATLGAVKYRRCLKYDMSGQRDYLTLAYSLRTVDGKLLVDGALLANDYTRMNGKGWMAVAVPRKGESDMKKSNAIMARPTAAGPIVSDYYMPTTAFSGFTASTNFLYQKATTLRSIMAEGALLATFSFYPGQATGTNLNLLFALGDVSSQGAPLFHWTTAFTRIALAAADVGAAVPDGVPVLNQSKTSPAPQPSPSPSPSPPPSSPSPSPVSPSPYPSPCSVSGAAYDGCTDTFDSGLAITHYYKLVGTTLYGALKADTQTLGGTTGWASLAYIPSPGGGMLGADALIVTPCSTCASGVKATAYNMGGYSTSTFSTTTQVVTYGSISASKLPTGQLLVRFTVNWKPSAGGKMQVRYGGGPYAAATGAMQKHLTYPVLACINSAGGVVAPTAAGC